MMCRCMYIMIQVEILLLLFFSLALLFILVESFLDWRGVEPKNCESAQSREPRNTGSYDRAKAVKGDAHNRRDENTNEAATRVRDAQYKPSSARRRTFREQSRDYDIRGA